MENKQLLSELLKEEDRLLKALEDIRSVKKWYQNKDIGENITPEISVGENTEVLKIPSKKKRPTEYAQEWTQEDKVYAILYEIKEGFNEDIARKLVQYSPDEFDAAKAKKTVENKTSILIKSGEIGYERIGKRYKYFINY